MGHCPQRVTPPSAINWGMKTALTLARQYQIVIVGLCLSLVAYFGAQYVPIASTVMSHTDAPCSRWQALRGLWSRHQRNQVQPAITSKCSRVSVDDNGFVLTSTPDGDYWVPSAEDATVLPLLLAQEASKIYASGSTPVLPGDIVLDGGAHVGVFVRVSLRAGAKLVVAIEPAPENIECLRRNFKAEIAGGRVIVYPKGVWNKDDVLPMHKNRNSAGDSFVLELDPGQPVINLPLTTIDKLTTELALPRVDYIKLDIKGAEVQAINGAARVLAKFRPRLATASEHFERDRIDIPNAVLVANPAYVTECGACYIEDGRVKPEVLHFR